MASWHAALDAPPAPRTQAFDLPRRLAIRRSSRPRHPRRALRRSSRRHRPRRAIRRSTRRHRPRRAIRRSSPPRCRSSRSRRPRGSIVRAPRSASTTTSRRRRRSSRSRSTPGKTNRPIHRTAHGKTERICPRPVAGRSGQPVHDITDLLGPEPLPEIARADDPVAALRPLFDPDAPFTAAATVRFSGAAAAAQRPRSGLIAVAAVVLALAGAGVVAFKWFGQPAAGRAVDGRARRAVEPRRRGRSSWTASSTGRRRCG